MESYGGVGQAHIDTPPDIFSFGVVQDRATHREEPSLNPFYFLGTIYHILPHTYTPYNSPPYNRHHGRP